MVFYELFCDFLGVFGTFKNSPSHDHSWNSSKTCLISLDGVLIKIWEKSKVPFLHGPTPNHNVLRFVQQFYTMDSRLTVFVTYNWGTHEGDIVSSNLLLVVLDLKIRARKTPFTQPCLAPLAKCRRAAFSCPSAWDAASTLGSWWYHQCTDQRWFLVPKS